MVTIKTEEKQYDQNKEPGGGITLESRIILLFLGLLIIGVIGYFSLGKFWIDSIFAHVGGLGIIGLLGGLAGIIAKDLKVYLKGHLRMGVPFFMY